MEEHNHKRPAPIEVCFNCSVSFNDDLQLNVNLDNEIPSSLPVKRNKVNDIIVTNSTLENSTTTTVSVSHALSSIFKLKYLNAFRHEEDEENQEELSLCSDCGQVLTQLYSLFNCFIQLQKLDSSLAHRIERLDEIIDTHQQLRINCDSIPLTRKYSNNSDGHAAAATTTTTIRKNKLKPSSPTEFLLKKSNNLIFNREPRIVLTRLSTQKIATVKEEEVIDLEIDDSLWEPTGPSSFDDDSGDNFPNDFLSPKAEDSDSKESDQDEEWTRPGRPANKKLVSKRQSKRRKIIQKSVKRSNKSKEKKVSSQSKVKLSTKLNSSEQVEGAVQNLDESTDNNVVVVKKRIRGPYKKKDRPPKPKKKKEKPPKSDTPMLRKTEEEYLEDPTFVGRNDASYKRRKTKAANPCWYCRLHFDTPDFLLEHTKRVHASKLTPMSEICLRCSKICAKHRLPSHLKYCELIPMGTILPPTIQCPECPKKFATARELRTHSLCHSHDRPFPCPDCSYAGKTRRLLNLHKQCVHQPVVEEENQKRKCDECGIILKNERYLRRHKVYRHTPEGQEKYRQHQERSRVIQTAKRRMRMTDTSTVCQICGVDFLTRGSLTFHRKLNHPEQYALASVCPLCGHIFSRVNSLSTHMKQVHSDARPYLCQKCGRDFKTANNLRKHDRHTHDEQGRLGYNAKTRERNRRKKLLKAVQLAGNINTQYKQPIISSDQGQQEEEMVMDQESSSNEYF